MPQTGKSPETGSRLVTAGAGEGVCRGRAGGQGGSKINCGEGRMTRNPLKTVVTRTSNRLTTWHVNYISIKLLLKKKASKKEVI